MKARLSIQLLIANLTVLCSFFVVIFVVYGLRFFAKSFRFLVSQSFKGIPGYRYRAREQEKGKKAK